VAEVNPVPYHRSIRFNERVKETSTMSAGTHPDSGSSSLAPGLPRRVHLLGAGGAGLSGAARLLLERGHLLSGHDRSGSDFTRALAELGVPITLGASRAADLPAGVGALARSAAVPEDDPQLRLARERGLPVYKYSELLPFLCPSERTLGVAGTHGKTTTTWMLHHALVGLARDRGPQPGALVGGTHREWGTNARAEEQGGWFAVEACEYDRSFLRLAPRGAIVTNVEADHLDYYGTTAALEDAFARFADRVHPDGLVVVGRSVPEGIEAAARAEVWRLGRELEIDLLAEERGRFAFRLRGPGWATPPTTLRVPGSFNVENAALALSLAIGLAGRRDAGQRMAAAALELSRFPGVARRFESWGTHGGVELVHDYAHHPTEVAATLEAARRAFPGLAIHVLFQPHQYSRTARFLAEFVEALRAADRIVVADVYGARAALDEHAACAEDVALRLRRAGKDALAPGAASAALGAAVEGLPRNAALLVLGAGDIDGIRNDLVAALAVRRVGAR